MRHYFIFCEDEVMATPIGHVLDGYLVYTCVSVARSFSNGITIWVSPVLAVSPDLDFLLSRFVGRPTGLVS